MITDYTKLESFGGAWEDWCANKYSNDAINLNKCNSKPMGFLTLAPWTDVGALQRGLPKPGAFIVDTFGPGTSPTSPVETPAGTEPADDDEINIGGLFGVPKKALWIGVGVLGVGLAAVLLTKKSRRGYAGYRRRKSRRSRR